MRDHYKFIKSGWFETTGDSYLDEKLRKVVVNLNHEIDSMLFSRNSISSVSSVDVCDDWRQQDLQDRHKKEQEKILEEIGEL